MDGDDEYVCSVMLLCSHWLSMDVCMFIILVFFHHHPCLFARVPFILSRLPSSLLHFIFLLCLFLVARVI
jgi:hypothetical protein